MKYLYTDTPHNVNNVQMGDDEMLSRGKSPVCSMSARNYFGATFLAPVT